MSSSNTHSHFWIVYLPALLFLALCTMNVKCKDLKTDIRQIENVVRDWEQELEGFVEIPETDIPDLNNKSLHIVEIDPNDTDSQSYLVYRRKSVDPTLFTRHVAYLRRFKAVSAVEWNPFFKPEDAVADGNFIELLVPSLYTPKRCNALVFTPAKSFHNYFYKQEWNCTLPGPYQDCCERPGSKFEAVELESLGKAVEEIEDFLDEKGMPIDEHLVGIPDEWSMARPKRSVSNKGLAPATRPLRQRRTIAKRKIKYTKKIGEDEAEILADQLKNIEGPPGYFALGEFYQDVLELMNGSEIVYEARERVQLSAKDNRTDVLDAETAMMMTVSSPKGLPSREDPTSAFTGFLPCAYTSYTTTRPAMDKLRSNIVKFYLHKLRAQCIPFVYEKTVDLFENDLVSITTGLRTALNTEHDLIGKAAVTKSEWNDLISAVMFVTITNAYMDVAERITRGVQDNKNALGEEISFTVRTVTVIAIRAVALIDETLSAHVVKTLQTVTTFVKEKFFAGLNDLLKLENYCISEGVECTNELEVAKRDQLQLISLMQFVVFGTSNALQKKERGVADEFNRFYIKTLKHTQDIYDKVHKMRKFQEADAEKAAVEDPKEPESKPAPVGEEVKPIPPPEATPAPETKQEQAHLPETEHHIEDDID